MLVLIVLIGGNYDWCLGGQAGRVQISQDFLLQQKMARAQKFVGSFLGGQCCAHLLTEWVLLLLETSGSASRCRRQSASCLKFPKIKGPFSPLKVPKYDETFGPLR